MPIAEINGQELYYEDSGGDGPAIVFSHGLYMDHEMFAPQVEALVSAGADMISAFTMTHENEAIGIARAAGRHGALVLLQRHFRRQLEVEQLLLGLVVVGFVAHLDGEIEPLADLAQA